MKPLLFIAFFNLLSLSAQARLGESPSQIEARYGTPVGGPYDVSTNQYTAYYKHGNFRIDVTFWNGKCAEEHIFADAGTTIDADTALSLFKTVSGRDKVSSRSAKAGGTLTMYEADGASGTFINNTEKGFYAVSASDKAFLEQASKKYEAEQNKKLDGF